MLTNLQQQKIDETLMKLGWQFHDSCTCGGTLRKKYKCKAFPGFIVRIAPRREQYDIQENGRIVQNGTITEGNTDLLTKSIISL
jgi:hypothetical protein